MVSVVAGPLLAEGLSLQITRTSPPGSAETTPNISLSNSGDVKASSQNIQSPGSAGQTLNRLDDSPPRTSDGPDEGVNILITRNSSHLPTQEVISQEKTNEIPYYLSPSSLPDFKTDYVPAAINFIRQHGPENAASVAKFFISQCRHKQAVRYRRVDLEYFSDGSPFKEWTLAKGETITDLVVEVASGYAEHFVDFKLPAAPGRIKAFILNAESVPIWLSLFDVVFKQIGIAITELIHEQHDQASLVNDLYFFLRMMHDLTHAYIPRSVWALSSIKKSIDNARRCVQVGNEGDQNADDQSAVEQDDNDDEQLDGSFTQKPYIKVPYKTLVFLRKVDTICAFLAGGLSLSKVKLSANSQVHSQVLDLPGVSAPGALKNRAQQKLLIELLVDTWKLSDKDDEPANTMTRTIYTQIQTFVINLGSDGQFRGPMHSEAATMASLLTSAEAEQSSKEHPIVTTCFDRIYQEIVAFQNLATSETSSQKDPTTISIGVAKKSCQACWDLGECITRQCQIRFKLPGAHTNFYPWTPPPWLPWKVLEDLEEVLLGRLRPMLANLVGQNQSRTSSPTSSIESLTVGDKLREEKFDKTQKVKDVFVREE
ncbi:hypothetical protein C8J56DRAFT_949421 [Mycena floridula]|nr:hypothetical protein C8J56DRAFT_949421 [Mycena floridula]